VVEELWLRTGVDMAKATKIAIVEIAFVRIASPSPQSKRRRDWIVHPNEAVEEVQRTDFDRLSGGTLTPPQCASVEYSAS
jgi:hypothetical protein